MPHNSDRACPNRARHPHLSRCRKMRRLVLNPERPVAEKREPLLGIPDAAKILNVSEKQVRRYINDPDPRKRLPVIRFGRLIRIDPVDLERFIRDRRWP